MHSENKNNIDKWKNLHCPNDKSPYDLLPTAKGIKLGDFEERVKTPIAVCKCHPNREYYLYADGHVEFKVTGNTW